MNRLMTSLQQLRNIGISAHIDSGKTTLTERMLFYTGRIHKMAEVRGRDGGATMDSMELERERGITIQSAATFCDWTVGGLEHNINVIDTPGHVDFTIEVERALSVLDGAVLVLCSVGGVQSQTVTVDRQMRRYNVPRIAFINKMDRTGADLKEVVNQLRERLSLNAVQIQVPMGAGDDFAGIIDLVEMEAVTYEGDNGELVVRNAIPAEYKDQAEDMRNELIEALADLNDDLAEKFLEDPDSITTAEVYAILRQATIDRDICPVMCGTAFKNKGVQCLLDAVCRYLPDPTEVTNQAYQMIDGEQTQVVLHADDAEPLCALAFKLEDTPYGQLTYTRVYQGEIKKGGFIFNSRTGKKHKVGRLMRMHADEREDTDFGRAGDIVALFGIDCASGDTFHDGEESYSMRTMFVPEPVVSCSIKPRDKKGEANLSKALGRFSKEDPTFRVERDDETQETLISGMGELQLQVYVERIAREYKCPVEVSPPQVRYRESISKRVEFSYTHKKQTGGRGQYAKIEGSIEPLEEGEFEFVETVVGGAISKEYLKAVEAGFSEALKQGSLIGAPVTGVRVTIVDGNTHDVDSSEMAFKVAARDAFRDNYMKCKPCVLEPIMKVEVEMPEQFQGRVLGDLTRRRGRPSNTRLTPDGLTIVEGEVPLSKMFSYANDLRSATEGRGNFTMEFGSYKKCPKNIQEELVEEYEKSRQKN